MVSIHLQPTTEKSLRELALGTGQTLDQLAQQILEDFIAIQNATNDSSEDWAQSSIALTPEVFTDEPWEEGT
jgi:predicted transcriptional regulator